MTPVVEINVLEATEEQLMDAWVDDKVKAYQVLRDLVTAELTKEQSDEQCEYIGPTPGVDREALLNKIVAIQERMAKGMAIIQDANDKISGFFQEHRWMWKLYKAWQGKLDMATTKKFLNDKRNANYIKWFDYRNKLWSHWHSLKNEYQEIAEEDKGVWNEYFKLVNEPVNYSSVHGDPEEFDNQEHLVVGTTKVAREANGLILEDEKVATTPQRRLDSELEAHLEETAAYISPLTPKEKNCNGYWIYKHGWVIDVTKKYVDREKIDKANQIRAERILAVMKKDENRYKSC